MADPTETLPTKPAEICSIRDNPDVRKVFADTRNECAKLQENAELQATRTEYLKGNPIFQNLDSMIQGYYTPNADKTKKIQYEMAFIGLRDSIMTTANVLLGKELEKYSHPVHELTPAELQQIDAAWQNITQYLDGQLRNIATLRDRQNGMVASDPKIDYADLVHFGDELNPTVKFWQKFEKNPQDKEGIKAGLKELLAQRINEAGTGFALEEKDDEPKTAQNFQKEIADLITLVAGQEDPAIDEAELKKIFAELEKDLPDGSPAKQLHGLAKDKIEELELFGEGGTDNQGREINEARRRVLELQAGVDKYLNNHDTSGTMLGKNGGLYQIFYYYGLSNSLALGAAGELIMHRQIPWQTLTALGVATGVAMPDKVDNWLSSAKLGVSEPDEEKIRDQVSGYSDNVKAWAKAIDVEHFKARSPHLRSRIRQLQAFGSKISTEELASYLSPVNAEKQADDPDHKGLGHPDHANAEKLRGEHDLTHLTDPKEKRQLFDLLRHSCEHETPPSTFLD